MNPLRSVWSVSIAVLGASIISPAIAQPHLEIDPQTPSFKRTLSLGDIRLVIDHRASVEDACLKRRGQGLSCDRFNECA
ncbi:MAG: hypothetical protein AAGA60_00800 [Cyanobacteria bacterium P01_E01_bin.42]